MSQLARTTTLCPSQLPHNVAAAGIPRPDPAKMQRGSKEVALLSANSHQQNDVNPAQLAFAGPGGLIFLNAWYQFLSYHT